MARSDADAAWLALGARVFRLPGIYGPGRSALDRVREGRAHRIDIPGQVFSRIHVEDIARGVACGLNAPAGAYNLADDYPCSQNELIEQLKQYPVGALAIVPIPATSEGDPVRALIVFGEDNLRFSEPVKTSLLSLLKALTIRLDEKD